MREGREGRRGGSVCGHLREWHYPPLSLWVCGAARTCPCLQQAGDHLTVPPLTGNMETGPDTDQRSWAKLAYNYILCVYMLIQCGVWCVYILYIYLCSVCVAVSGGAPPSSSASTHSVWPC